MTATATAYRHSHRHPGGLIIWIMLITIMLAAVLAIPEAVVRTHATLHTEASYIRQCAASPENLLQVWLNSSGERLNCLIDLGGGAVGDLVLQFCRKSGWNEITAYIIGDGSLGEAIQTLSAKACTRVWTK